MDANIKMRFKTPLDAAIADLKGRGVISKDLDVATALNYHKSVISGYKSGSATMSEEFANKFEQHYGLKLSDYTEVKSSELKSSNNVSLDEVMEMLRRILEQQVLARAEIRAFGEYQVMKDAKNDRDVREKIMEQINMLVGVNLGANEKERTHVHS